MENSYGIGVRNRYELFYDDDVDPMDILNQHQEQKKDKTAEKENKGKGTKSKGTVLKKTTKPEAPAKITDKTNSSGVQSRTPRNTEGRTRFTDREERNNRRNRPEGEGPKDGGPPARFEGEGGRGRGRGMGRGRGRGGRGRGGGGGMGGPDGRGKREYDRQSGMVTSGVKPVDKREGSGSYNWGSDKDQIEEHLNAEQSTELDTSAENVEKASPPQTEESHGEEEAAPKEEEGPKEMTLDEWKALQGQRSKPTFNLRKAGEGENQTQWKKTYVLKKKIEDEDDEDDEEEEEVQHGRRKVLLDIDFQFTDSPARGRGRGRGRGGPGGRGRGGRGGPGGGDRGERGEGRPIGRGEGRGERGGDRGEGRPAGRGRQGGGGRQEAPKMDDERDFPSLG